MAAIGGVINNEAVANVRITQHHSGRVAAIYYIKRRREEAAHAASQTLEEAIAFEDAGGLPQLFPEQGQQQVD